MKGDVWRDVSVSGGALDKGLSLGTMYASSSDGGIPLSFISGGGSYFDGGLVIFNASDPQNPSWKNVTSQDLPYFRGVDIEYVRYGAAGMLMVLGGDLDNTADAFLRKLNSIQIYDIASSKWFTQITTGNAPISRQSYCSAVSAAPDDSSMHLILYGGYLNGASAFNETDGSVGVFMLVMPAFEWIQINTTHAEGTRTYDPRVGHSCTTYQDRGMFVFGGRGGQDPNCTSTFSTFRALDLTTFEWQRQWPLKNTTYEVPQAVIDVVGGSSSGGAKPPETWQQTLGDNLAFFKQTVPRYNPENPPQRSSSTTNINGAGTTSPTATNTPSQKSNSGISNGAIAGAVIGGIAGLILVLAVIFFVFRARRRRQANPPPEWQKAELGAENPKNPSLLARLGFATRHELPANQAPVQEMEGQGNMMVEAPSGKPRRDEGPHELEE